MEKIDEYIFRLTIHLLAYGELFIGGMTKFYGQPLSKHRDDVPRNSFRGRYTLVSPLLNVDMSAIGIREDAKITGRSSGQVNYAIADDGFMRHEALDFFVDEIPDEVNPNACQIKIYFKICSDNPREDEWKQLSVKCVYKPSEHFEGRVPYLTRSEILRDDENQQTLKVSLSGKGLMSFVGIADEKVLPQLSALKNVLLKEIEIPAIWTISNRTNHTMALSVELAHVVRELLRENLSGCGNALDSAVKEYLEKIVSLEMTSSFNMVDFDSPDEELSGIMMPDYVKNSEDLTSSWFNELRL